MTYKRKYPLLHNRRNFFKKALISGLFLAGTSGINRLFSSHVGFSNPIDISSENHTIPEISEVIIVKGTNVNTMIKRGLEHLSFPTDLITGKKVIIKPNTHWSEEYPSTTDPESIVPIVDFFRENGAGNITVTDGSGVGLDTYKDAFDFIKFEEVLDKKGVKVVPINIWDIASFNWITNPNWKYFGRIEVDPVFRKPNVLISLTCLKRHWLSYLTAALKNNIGAISARTRYRAHYLSREDFLMAIPEIADAVRPLVSIIDARDILIHTGAGFSQDRSNLKKGVNTVLLSTDMVALDTIAAGLMMEHDKTFDIELIKPMLEYASSLGLGNNVRRNINVIELKT